MTCFLLAVGGRSISSFREAAGSNPVMNLKGNHKLGNQLLSVPVGSFLLCHIYHIHIRCSLFPQWQQNAKPKRDIIWGGWAQYLKNRHPISIALLL